MRLFGAMGMTPLWRSESMTLSLHGLERNLTTCPCHGIDGLLMLEVGSSTFTLKTQFPEYCTPLVEAAKLILRPAIWWREKLSCCPYYQRGYNSYRYHTFPGKKKNWLECTQCTHKDEVLYSNICHELERDEFSGNLYLSVIFMWHTSEYHVMVHFNLICGKFLV